MSIQIFSFLKSKYLASLIGFLAGLAAIRIYIARGMGLGMEGSEDYILFYLSGIHLFNAEKFAELNSRLIHHVAGFADISSMFRLQLRTGILNEYSFTGGITVALSRMFKATFDMEPQLYPLFLAQSITFGMAAATLIVLLATIWMVAVSKRRTFVWAFVLTVLLFALLSLHSFPFYTDAVLFVHPVDQAGIQLIFSDAPHILNQIGHLIVDPGAQFAPFGFTPRANLALLMISVFVLRWHRRYGLSYLLLALLTIIHLSQAGLMIAMFLMLDLFVRPNIYRRPFTLATAAFALIVFATRENVWQHAGQQGWQVAAMFIGIIVLIVFILKGLTIRGNMIAAALFPLSWFQTFLRRRNLVASDLIAITVGWIVSLVILYVLLNYFDIATRLQAFYVWGRIHGRILMMLWPSILFGLFILTFYWVNKKKAFRKPLTVAIPLAGLAVLAILAQPTASSISGPSVLSRVASSFFLAERQMRSGPLRHFDAFSRDELIYYYAIARSIDSGKDFTKYLTQ